MFIQMIIIYLPTVDSDGSIASYTHIPLLNISTSMGTGLTVVAVLHTTSHGDFLTHNYSRNNVYCS